MSGIKALRKLQLGVEATPGTPVAATTIWRGTGVLDDQRVIEVVDEDVGSLPGYDRTEQVKLLAAVSMDATPFTFEQFCIPCDSGIKTVAGVKDGTGSGYAYTYPLPTTALNAIKARTLEGGDDTEAERMEYAFCEKIGLSGKGGELLQMQSDWKARQVALNAFTGSLALPAVSGVAVSKGKLYIDLVGGVIGTTNIANVLLGLNLELVTGWVPFYALDGQEYFSTHEMSRPRLTGTLTFKHVAAGAARKVDWRAQTAKQFRLIWQGPALTTPGTAYTYKTLTLDFASKVLGVSKLGEQDGNDVLEVKVDSRYNSTAALYASIVVVNELAALPG